MDREKLKRQLVVQEELRFKPYRCSAGKLSIGVGRNLDDRGITRAEADLMLENDIDLALEELRRNLPWFAQLDGVRQAVLVNMCFNLGWTRLAQFSRMLSAVRRGDYVEAAKEMKASLWAKQVKSRAVTLERMMETGKWP